MALFAGADGCPHNAWVVATLDARGAFLAVDLVGQDFREVVRRTQDADLTLVDVPIGLVDEPEGRACDRLARRLLGPRASSVFTPPVRAAFGAAGHAEACARNEAVCGKRLSRQSYHILHRIADVDVVMRERPDLQASHRESHPEVCFAALNGWRPAAHKKQRRDGLGERLDLLARKSERAREVFAEALGKHPRRSLRPDDIVDAMLLAVAARAAWASGVPTLPADPPRDAFGLRMEMVCPAGAPMA